MGRLYLDFESYWADDFTLKKMTPVEYIQDPRFEALGCAFAFGDEAPFWVDGPDLPDFFQYVDWPNVFAISHNALFDMLILSLRYGVIPGCYGDTLAMARNALAHMLPSLSLQAIAKHYGMDPKWDTVSKTKGLSLSAIMQDAALYQELRGYACDDLEKCRTIFANLIRREGFPIQELETIDMVTRMTTMPRFELDTMVLAEHLNAVKVHKQTLLDNCYMDASDVGSLMSDRQLEAKFLFMHDVDIPMKISKTTGKLVNAFAKTDKAFTALLEHDNPMVQALVAARLGHKSTLEETRTQRLLSIANVVEKMPVPLKYSGAHTHRFSGDWKINLQNLPRGGELRKAFSAPKGELVVAVDASQIEARINATMAGESKLINAFAGTKGEIVGLEDTTDVYAWFAGYIYRDLGKITKENHPNERFVGKTAILSLGYGSSWSVFQAMCRNQGNVTLTDSQAMSVVMIYRSMFKQIRANWRHAQNVVIPLLMNSQASDVATELGFGSYEPTWGPVKIVRQALILPNGNQLRYADLRLELIDGKFEFRYKRGNMEQKIYGAKLVENVVQALAFVHIMEVAKRVKKLTHGSLLPVHQVHDELIYIVDEKDADWVSQLVTHEMSRSPEWMPTVPLAAEAHIGKTYFDAK